MNPMKMMKQVQEMQAKMAKMQEELGNKEYEAEAGGGAVKAVCNGHGDLKSVKIDPGILDDGDAEMLEDLVVTAVNEAAAKGKEEMANSMKQMMPAGLPGMPGLGF